MDAVEARRVVNEKCFVLFVEWRTIDSIVIISMMRKTSAGTQQNQKRSKCTVMMIDGPRDGTSLRQWAKAQIAGDIDLRGAFSKTTRTGDGQMRTSQVAKK